MGCRGRGRTVARDAGRLRAGGLFGAQGLGPEGFWAEGIGLEGYGGGFFAWRVAAASSVRSLAIVCSTSVHAGRCGAKVARR